MNETSSMQDLNNVAASLFSRLKSNLEYSQAAHWAASGETSYSDHILFERIYDENQEEIDKLAEKLIPILDVGFLNPIEITLITSKKLESTIEFSEKMTSSVLADNLKKSEEAVIQEIESFRKFFESHKQLSLGLDDLITELHNTHQNHIYLLGQRIKKISIYLFNLANKLEKINPIYTFGIYKLANEIEDFERQYKEEIDEELKLQKQEETSKKEFYSPEDLELMSFPELWKLSNSNAINLDKLILEANGFEVLSSVTQSVLLGKGMYGRVYRGVYQGKNAAAKLMLGDKASKDDINIWERIISKAQSIPGSEKYLPKIYKMIDRVDQKNLKYSIIIMEILKPAPQYFKDIFDGLKAENNKNMLMELKNLDNLEDFITYIFEDLNSYFKFKMDFRPSQLIKIRQKIKEGIISILFDPDIIDNVEYFIEQIKHLVAESLYKNNNLKFKAELGFTLDKFFYEKFPKEFESYEEIYELKFKNIPEVYGFIKFLIELGKNGIYYNDLHFNNIMMGDDDNLKIMDVGLFDLSNS